MGKLAKRPHSGLKSVKQILSRFDWDQDKSVSQEFQLYGYRLAEELDDFGHKSMYIKFAKTLPRVMLEEAKNFVHDAPNVRNKGKLFMWKLGQLKKENRDEELRDKG